MNNIEQMKQTVSKAIDECKDITEKEINDLAEQYGKESEQ